MSGASETFEKGKYTDGVYRCAAMSCYPLILESEL